MNMKKWFNDIMQSRVKRPLPILSFPAVQLMGVTVRELISDSALQAEAMARVSREVPIAACVSFMDLSVEAEAFGSQIRVSDDEVPTVIGRIISSGRDAQALRVPSVGTGRTGHYVRAIEAAAKMITDRPVLAGAIGPFSLAGRLMDVSEALVNCYEEPDMVHMTMEKTTEFVIEYVKAFKAAGADGVVLAEPLTGLLAPELAAEFSCPYVKRIISAVQDDGFALIYHNCGNTVPHMAAELAAMNAMAYHFGNAVDMADMLEKMPHGVPVMGNIDPAGVIRNGTPADVREATLSIMRRCRDYPNFIISSGCDIPPMSPWDNIRALFAAAEEFYA